ncbi:MAG: M81 family metallopeptidase [Planctomycetes bacterium]|nr:M81 family metallopeptidase [Planctomycetota bacterium]
MRIGILAFLHESNTFIAMPTTWRNFEEDTVAIGNEILNRFVGSHHELGGFLAGLDRADHVPVEVVPILAVRATPSGTISEEAFDELLSRTLSALQRSMPLDGLLVAAHGAAVSEKHRDADGYWLTQIRARVGAKLPVVVTLDAHANLSPAMVEACTAVIAYRTNPHLDQRVRGEEAAKMLMECVMGKTNPTMAAAFPPLVINIERQSTDEPHLRVIYEAADRQLDFPDVLSNSLLLGFPYADVCEMGASVVVITNNDLQLAQQLADELADELWRNRNAMKGVLVDVKKALDLIETTVGVRFGLLDMGDNVGGGSAADGTVLARALCERNLGPAFVCIADAQAVAQSLNLEVGATVELLIGGHTDHAHGDPLLLRVEIVSIHSGRFSESKPRHGGIVEFDQGATVVVRACEYPMTLLLTSKRMVPFSLQQLISCGIEPSSFRVLVAKGVHAPLAAYREVCDRFIRVNTPGSTCADLSRMDYHYRRHPLFPFDSFPSDDL